MLSTVDLPVLTSLHQTAFYIENIVYHFTNQATLLRRSTVLSLPLLLVVLGITFGSKAGV
jgi:hypothetical protein